MGYVLDFFNHAGNKVATGYRRLLKGGRGEYIEFEEDDICWEMFEIPEAHQYRLQPDWEDKVYWREYRTVDSEQTKLYEQLKTVKYADYLVGKFYISPALLRWESEENLNMEPI